MLPTKPHYAALHSRMFTTCSSSSIPCVIVFPITFVAGCRSRFSTLYHFPHSAVRGQRHDPAALYPGEDPVPIVQEAGWTPGPVCTGAKNLAPTGIRSPDRQGCSQSLYRLTYPAHSSQAAVCQMLRAMPGELFIHVDNGRSRFLLTHCGRVTQICVFNTVKLGTSASSP